MRAAILVAGLAALSLSACTSINAFTGQSQISDTAGGAAIGAGTGAVVGALAGAATHNDPRITALIGAGVGALTGAAVGQYMDQQEAQLRAQLQGTGVSVTRSGNEIILNMPSNITFSVDSATVQASFDRTIVDVYGYTDNTGTIAHNQDLSQRRAVAVATILANQGIDQRRFYIQGKGEDDPIASNAAESGRSQNRRVEIQISPLQQG
jgi:outer membrane protein OmpA-like peptidoglycan-associated protein